MEPSENVHKALVKTLEAFNAAVINDLRVNYHPDNDFHEYIGNDDKQSFTDSDADKLNTVQEAFFQVLGDEVYEIGLPTLLKAIDDNIKNEAPLKPKGLLGE